MEAINHSSTLSNSWETFTLSKLHNTIDVECVSTIGKNNFYIDDVLQAVVPLETSYSHGSYVVGYGKTYKLTATDGGSSQLVCHQSEYSNSPILNFVTGGDFIMVSMIALYILFFSIGLRISFFQR